MDPVSFTTGAASIALDSIDPFERGSAEKFVRSSASLFPGIAQLEVAERFAEIKHHKDLENHKKMTKEFQDSGCSKRDAEIHALWQNDAIDSSSACLMLGKNKKK